MWRSHVIGALQIFLDDENYEILTIHLFSVLFLHNLNIVCICYRYFNNILTLLQWGVSSFGDHCVVETHKTRKEHQEHLEVQTMESDDQTPNNASTHTQTHTPDSNQQPAWQRGCQIMCSQDIC